MGTRTFHCPHCGQPRDSLSGYHVTPEGLTGVRCATPAQGDAEERAATIAHLGEHCLIQPGDCAGMTNLRGLLAQAVNLLQAKEGEPT